MSGVARAARVVSVGSLGAYRTLEFEASDIADAAAPGQFVSLRADPVLLRRPFSVWSVDRARGTVGIAFDVVGDGTRWLAARAPGDVLDLVGPLGRGFTLDGEGAALVAGGGFGAAGLSFLARELRARGRETHAILGARTAARVFRDAVLDECASVTVATDDGTAGLAGTVVDAMPEVIARAHIGSVHACGPLKMLEAVAVACRDAGVRCEVAFEEFMACGIGVCWTCVVPVRDGDEIRHARACADGPVFEGPAIAWA